MNTALGDLLLIYFKYILYPNVTYRDEK